jgi:hypothetical protein
MTNNKEQVINNKGKKTNNKEKRALRKHFLLCSLLFLACYLIPFASCENNLDTDEAAQPENGYGKVSVILNEGRTIFPSTASFQYRYTFTKAGAAAGSVIVPDNEGNFILEVGDYTVKVDAQNNSTIMASGVSGRFTVNKIGITSVTVRLSPAASTGNGTFKYTITVPEGAAITITLEKWLSGTNIALESENITPGSGKIGKTGELNLADGFYLFTASIRKGTHLTGINEIIYIYPSMKTEYSKEFVDDNFTAIPIRAVEISIIAPVKAEVPAATAAKTGNFTAGTVTWSPSVNVFLGSTVYTATVTLTADSGYTFTGLAAADARINGQAAAVSNNTGETVTLSHTFPATNTKEVSGITIKTPPTKLTYTHGEKLDLSGMAVTLAYDDTTTEDVAAAAFDGKNITPNPAHGDYLVHLTHNGHPVAISYGHLTVNTGNITVNAKNASALSIITIPAQIYIGSGLKPDVTVYDGETELDLTKDYTVSYNNNTNAGTAIVTITGTGNYTGSQTVPFTIDKANPVITWPTAADITYGAALSDSALNDGVHSTTGTFVWDTPAIVPTVINSGYSVTFTPIDTDNYNTQTHTVSITVNKANPAVTAWPTAAALTYGAALSASALNGGASLVDGTFAWTNGATVPTVTNSGYSVTFRPTDTDNYNTVANMVSITVSKANPTVTTWPTAAAITYSAALSASALSGSVHPTPGTFAWTNGATIPTVINSGYSVTFTPTDTANYNTATHIVSITVNNITYSVTQIGGVAGSATTTGLTFTFNVSIDNHVGISIGDITVGGTAEKGSAAFIGSGTSWTLSPITVDSSGNATVSINKIGVEPQSKTLQVYAVGTAVINIGFAEITDEADGIAIYIPVLHRVNGASTADLTLTNPEQYDPGSISWKVNGVVIGTEDSVTLNAKHPAYNTLGTHDLMISVQKDGKYYDKTVPFTVAY